MRRYFSRVWAVFAKDVRAEIRTKEIFSAMFVFSIMAVLVFAFAMPALLINQAPPVPKEIADQLGITQVTKQDVAPGLLWVAYVFSGVLGLNRSFIIEKDKGSLEGLLLAPADRSAIYLGKAFSNFLFMLIVELLVTPLFSAFFNYPALNIGLLPVILLGTIGFAEIGTLFAAMAVNTKAREVLLPVLFFSIMLPVIIAAANATAAVLANRPFDEISGQLQFIAVFDIIFFALPILLFELVVEE